MATKRLKNGKWVYRISRKNLMDVPIYATFEAGEEAEGDIWAANVEAMLDKGIVPPAFKKAKSGKIKKRILLKDVIADEIKECNISRGDDKLLEVIARRHSTTLISSIDYQWAEKWIQYMKRVEVLSPTTIRHHVGALARLLDRVKNRGDITANPLRVLAKGYSTYSKADLSYMPEGKKEGRRDQSRERRLEPLEEENVLKILAGELLSDDTPRFDLHAQAALELLFTWAVETAMRLSEMYTVDKAQVDLAQRTIFLGKTKNGSSRQVPMTSLAIAAYETYLEHCKKGARGMAAVEWRKKGLVFPWWDGDRSLESMNRTTAKLSAQFARIFAAAGCADVRFHDLRHEATSRFFERTDLSDIEIAKITGHKGTAMLMRYANLRGSRLAGRLW